MAELRPQANQYILGISSLWLLIPSLGGLYGRRETLLAAATLVTALVSTAYWRRGVRGSALHAADLACARCLFGLLLWTTGGAPIALPAAAATCYVVCEALFNAGDFDMSMWMHLLFRFLGYWWTHVAVLGPASFRGAFLLSAAYWIHAVAAWAGARRDASFVASRAYAGGAARVVALIAGAAAALEFAP